MTAEVDYKREYSLTQLGGAPEENNGNAEDNHQPADAAATDGPQGFISFSPQTEPPVPSSPRSTNNNNKATATPTKQESSKKKWGLFGIFKKKDKKEGKSSDEKKLSDKKPTSGGSKENLEQPKQEPQHHHHHHHHHEHHSKPTSEGSGHHGEPKEEVPEDSSKAKKIVVVSSLADLPEDCHKLIKQSGLPTEKLEENFRILLRVLHFRTGVIYKVPEDVDIPAFPQPPKSHRFKPGAEYVVEMGELKKAYKELEEVGKGGFGTVYHARSVKEKGKMVAIKKMPHSTKKHKTNNFHEISIMSACNHPNIVKFVTCHEVKEELWIVMEYLEGGTFEEAAKAWNFNEANLAYVARELLKGISYLHANQLAHRDLKSANIMMSIQGQVKLIDFGLCADMSTGFPRHMVGSPFWMPPEMIQGKPHTYAVDIWSFAISLLEMANQKPPMIESAVKAMFTVATEGCPQLFAEPEKWSDKFKDFLGLCLKVDPEERATAEQLLKHPFIQLADTRTNMEHILRRIFLSNSLLNSGF